MWKKRILPLLCALALLAGLLPGRVQAAQTKPVRYLTVTGTPAQLETGRRLPQATPELASDAGAALHLTQGHWYNSITALQQGDPLPDGASVFGTGTYYLGLELKADDGWALTDETRLCINRSADAALYTRQGATLLAICYRSPAPVQHSRMSPQAPGTQTPSPGRQSRGSSTATARPALARTTRSPASRR